jgi:outer membrane biosynthesis protein TonB
MAKKKLKEPTAEQEDLTVAPPETNEQVESQPEPSVPPEPENPDLETPEQEAPEPEKEPEPKPVKKAKQKDAPVPEFTGVKYRSEQRLLIYPTSGQGGQRRSAGYRAVDVETPEYAAWKKQYGRA